MNKSELLKALEVKLGSRKAAHDALEAVVDTIIREVAKGGSVGITGFGTFEKVARAARTGRNPRTGETVRIRKTSVPKFRPGTQFKEYVAAPSKMPKSGLVGIRASAGTKTGGAAGGGTGAKKAASAKKTTAKKAPAKAVATKKSATRAATKKAAKKS
ncbi:HU family DNA-binding protein [Nostocoides sp. F2B08]|uniref:HU family DNA-binding protein n=1 Tax=Nostocoides sp. F2B08 TaxID=2653936 RepID=UPI001263CE9F|nr:HU family DNA-binding protein [Tetrasphaera sp. F2B08]KAB7746078.1 HU family DNA-binding protein [Tetrasphaera sp. F2B08]